MMQEMNRREFVAMAAGACAACACLGAEALAAEKAGPFDAGLLSEYSQDGISDKFLAKGRFFLVRRQGKIYASTATCPHKGGAIIIQKENPNQLYCTKHKALFDAEGHNLTPPAKTGLARFAISLDANKHIIVDTSKKFEQSQWEQASSYLTV